MLTGLASGALGGLATVADFSGVSYSPYSIRYTDNSQLKGFGAYDVGDINGDIAFMQQQGIKAVKTYNAGLTQGQPFNQLEAYVNLFSTLNTNPAGAATTLATMNNEFAVGGGTITGTKWIIGQASANNMHYFAGTNVSGPMLDFVPDSQSALSVTLLNTDGITTRTVDITPASYQYTDFSNQPQTITYSAAHWDIEIAMMNIANGQMNIQAPADSESSYSATPLGGINAATAMGLIVGNEVLSNDLTAAQVAQVMAFAKARRDAYGLTDHQLPITSSTNSPGNWQGDMANEVLPYVDGIIFYNTYGFPFDANGQAESGADVTPESGITNVINTHESFVQWLQANGHGHITPIIGEHGWPSNSEDNSFNSFNVDNERDYYLGTESYEGILKRLSDLNVTNFLFEMFDEPWKGTGDSSEAHFGIAVATQEQARDSGEPWTYPQVRTMKFEGLDDLMGTQVIPEPGVAGLLIAAGLLFGARRLRRR